jgi:hypothetical protein
MAPTCPSVPSSSEPQRDPCSTASQFKTAVNLLSFPTAPQRLGAVLYEILAKLPGVMVIGSQVDALGRSGTAIEDPSSGNVFVLDPSTGDFLEWEQLATTSSPGIAAGSLESAETFGPVSIVSGLGTLPT